MAANARLATVTAYPARTPGWNSIRRGGAGGGQVGKSRILTPIESAMRVRSPGRIAGPAA